MTLKDDLKNFDIKSAELADSIKQAAFASGGFPHEKKMKEELYDETLHLLQIELLKAQSYIKEKGLRLLVIFEGRDAAGKGGAISRIREHLNPRSLHIAALSKPTETEQGQFYLQRYIKELPSAGNITLFDRSWYNRAVVEPVMGFCKPEQSEKFIEMIPKFEQILVDDGMIVIKFWLTVGQAMQLKRLHKRYHDPLTHWKLSPIDFAAIGKWDDYTKAIEHMLTHTNQTPWTIIQSNDKYRARIAIMRTILQKIDYADKNHDLVNEHKKIVLSVDEFLAKGGEE